MKGMNDRKMVDFSDNKKTLELLVLGTALSYARYTYINN